MNLLKVGISVDVFNTSESEYRFNGIEGMAGSFEESLRSQFEELRQYLCDALARCDLYLLLMTETSLARPWVRWELREARTLEKDHRATVLPCYIIGIEPHNLSDPLPPPEPYEAVEANVLDVDYTVRPWLRYNWLAVDFEETDEFIRRILPVCRKIMGRLPGPR
jgi:hypothetical protein